MNVKQLFERNWEHNSYLITQNSLRNRFFSASEKWKRNSAFYLDPKIVGK